MAEGIVPTGKVVWAPPLAPGMACRTTCFGFGVTGTITEVIDPVKGEVMVLADPGQDCTATQSGETWQLFTPGEPFKAHWESGLNAVQRADGNWERPVYETVRIKNKAIPGWQLSDAVRCDPAYRNRATGGGLPGANGRYVATEKGRHRLRWSTTLLPEALEILRTVAERENLHRNEVVEKLLMGELTV